MEKNRHIARILLLSGLALATHTDMGPQIEEPQAPLIKKLPEEPAQLPIEEFNLPTMVQESRVAINDQHTLFLDVDGKEPDRIMQLENKESGEINPDVQVGIYYEEKDGKKVWGLRVDTPNENMPISVDIIVPETSQTALEVGQEEKELVSLSETEVAALKNESGEVDIVIFQSQTSESVDEFNRFQNGGAFMAHAQEIGIKVSIEVENIEFNATESLPQS